MKTFRIYKITNQITNKIYIGLTSLSLKQRWYHHCHNKSKCPRISRSIKKHGEDNFIIEQIDETITLEQAEDLECYYINKYNSLSPNGYNLTTGGACSQLSEETKEKMSKSQLTRFSLLSEEDKQFNLRGVNNYIENKKEAVIAISITSFEVIKFSTINSAIEAIGNIGIYNNLSRKDIHAGGYMWFYHDDTRSDDSYIEETKQILIDKKYIPGKMMNYLAWQDPEKRASRIEAMKEAASDRARPIVGVNRFDGSIIHIPSINEALKTTLPSGDKITWGSLRQSLVGNCKHAYNYCWFYKEDKPYEFYLEQAKQRLGSLFDDTNMKPILAESLDGTITYRFNNLYEVETKGFNKKETRQVLTNRRKTYKGFKFTNI